MFGTYIIRDNSFDDIQAMTIREAHNVLSNMMEKVHGDEEFLIALGGRAYVVHKIGEQKYEQYSGRKIISGRAAIAVGIEPR